MEFARIAARHFKADHHEYYVTPSDVATALPLIAAAYDQPFGNASAIPTYYVRGAQARTASSACSAVMAGTSCSEGTTAMQGKAGWRCTTGAKRRAQVLQARCSGCRCVACAVAATGPELCAQASLPMPARYESYNLLERLGPENVFARNS